MNHGNKTYIKDLTQKIVSTRKLVARLEGQIAPLEERLAKAVTLIDHSIETLKVLGVDLTPAAIPVLSEEEQIAALRETLEHEVALKNLDDPQYDRGFVWCVKDMGPELGLMVGQREETSEERAAREGV